MEYTRTAHNVYHCRYHLVMATKYRRKIFNKGICNFLKERLKQVVEHYPQLRFIEVNHDVDHVHILVSIPPSMAVGSVVRIIKSNLSKDLKRKFAFLKEVYWGTDGIWSDGYFVSTTGIDESIIRRYIEFQGKEDSGQTKFDL